MELLLACLIFWPIIEVITHTPKPSKEDQVFQKSKQHLEHEIEEVKRRTQEQADDQAKSILGDGGKVELTYSK